MTALRCIVSTILLASPAAAQPLSLLDGLLSDAPALSASLTNVAQNLGVVDATFALETERHFVAMLATLEGWSVGRASHAAGLGNRVSEMQGEILRLLAPADIDIGEITTTAVGSLQAADMTALFNASGTIERVVAEADAAALAVEAQGGVARLAALQNISFNAGQISGDAALLVHDVNFRAETIATTAIGALQNGALTTTVDLDATVRGQLGAVTQATVFLVEALVGS